MNGNSPSNAELTLSVLQRKIVFTRQAQLAVLPSTFPGPSGYEIFAKTVNCDDIGKGYYDCFTLPGKVAFSFGEVAGQSLAALPLWSRTMSCVRNTLKLVPELDRAVGVINDHLCVGDHHRFVICFLAVLDLTSHQLHYVNAGLPTPIVRTLGSDVVPLTLDDPELPFGIQQNQDYQVGSRTIESGETLVLSTESVHKTWDAKVRQYTEQQLKDFVKGNNLNAHELGESLVTNVLGHCDGKLNYGDITLMTIGRPDTA